MMDELLQDLQINCEIDRARAEIALGTVLSFMGTQLPSPLMGRVKSALSTNGKASTPHHLLIGHIGNAVQ